ncbi:MAG TPA: 16S rRNA (cytosine(1402)-N(4))-methyltransferase RsmH [Chitinophagales bacterium]|nr:16S rRNA (cytosine(1402)-N(4))-methyltransferase RsmH [Chitinophagales bacterium]HMU69648.1 16S rRNA (cytosine(1402)-N(4))-methyltransferase RsmH [Chitinophagales bacterium]HMX04493.1 16S rRNA (cytosine(1402)-N(4))-methyltransferase RsmH [Chitinophagales bacterium]HMZ88152.1 16S rRNA (cytosine(1402)-N(4))-methyltransferase RsmH [Chitinophagales bacterium]HNA57557.1 16S rRNA (cytosine(1402)-N(4))-methyltransferase RsmH [Chitinophagales bacterium]
MSEAYHIPVLLHPSIQALITDPDGIYVDATFGGGGHSKAIVEQLSPKGKLFCFDQDPDAKKNFIDAFSATNATFIPQNFRHMQKFLRVNGVSKVHGILADLGVSSHQFDTGDRGFSIRFDGPLDMRMAQQGTQSAYALINESSAEQLQYIFGHYGEVRNARQLANAIVQTRNLFAATGGIRTTTQLRDVALTVLKGEKNPYLAQVFQALRIAVNDEMRALEEMLESAASLLMPQGRLVVISYHSLEDRLVKNYMRAGNAAGEAEEDIMGRKNVPFKVITRKPVVADDEELSINPRARSAKMRVAEKI